MCENLFGGTDGKSIIGWLTFYDLAWNSAIYDIARPSKEFPVGKISCQITHISSIVKVNKLMDTHWKLFRLSRISKQQVKLKNLQKQMNVLECKNEEPSKNHLRITSVPLWKMKVCTMF